MKELAGRDPIRALVVENDRDVLDLLSSHLRHAGCAVEGAETGEHGLDLARTDPPDLVVLDLLLPGIQGGEVLRLLQGDPRTQRCRVAICSILDPDDLPAGVHVLPKPFRRKDVLCLVNSLELETAPQLPLKERGLPADRTGGQRQD